MLKASILIILSIALVVIDGVFLIKNFLIHFKGSDNGYKNILLATFAIVSLLCCFSVVVLGFSIQNIIGYLKYNSHVTPTEAAQLKETVIQGSKNITQATIIGYISFGFSFLTFKNIQREIQREIDKPKKLWDWNLIRKYR